MRNAGLVKVLFVAVAAMCTGCSQPAWDNEGGPSVDLFSGPLRVVQAQARVADGAIRLDLRNAGTEAMCFWAADFPTQEHALGFRVFTAEDVEKRTGDVLPAGNRVVALDPGQILTTQVGVRPWFESELRDGECVLFEAIYFPCSEAEGLSRTEGTPLAGAGLVQSSWRVRGGQLNLIPQAEPSCRAHSGLIRHAPNSVP